MHAYRTHTCGALNRGHVGETVRLSGWVHRVRDHGGILFVDLRDHHGITQVLADPDSPVFAEVERYRAEWVVRIDGEVRARDPELVNPRIATGEIEVYIRAVEVLSRAEELPLPVFGEPEYPEDIRLAYRFLDLRRDGLHRRIMLRAEVIAAIRRHMTEQGFTEFQTPILTASSPEGARDFLVPSRLHPGKFYALPQAPQQFKQLIMVAGFDRYFQIAPCFRDEDPRADRSPGEFYQLDMEMSFATQDDVFDAIEPVLAETFAEFAGFGRERPWKITSGGVEIDMGQPQGERHAFRRIPYTEAMEKYGTDKPDLRNPIEMQVVSDHFRGSGFQVFAKILQRDGTEIRAIPAPGGGSRRFCDRMNSWAQKEGLPGMGYIMWREEPLPPEARNDPNHPLWQIAYQQEVDRMIAEGTFEQFQGVDLSKIRIAESNFVAGAGPIASNLGPEGTEALRRELGLNAGDAAFFLAGTPKSFLDVAAKARNVIAEELGLVAQDRFDFCWVVDFPMFEWNEEEEKIDFSHNPFSMPQGGLEALENEHPLAIRGFQYDIVCNGVELSSGAIRNHRPEIMYKAFEIAGYPRAEVERRFGGMLNAFRYGAPPHGGIAPGIDRIVMLLAGVSNIREVIMFPMNQRAEDLLMQAPSEVTPKQLRELGIRIVRQE